MVDPLRAISPLDGRYAARTEPLRKYASEAALMRARLTVEVEYLLALTELDAVPIALDPDERSTARSLYENLDLESAHRIKQIETEGTDTYPATNHDVKALEYFLREDLPERAHPWIHFGLTSEDATNLAYRLLVRDATREVLVPELRTIRDELVELAHDYRAVPMLARTHGQPATPTTFGKEMAVFAARLGRAIGRIETADAELAGKLAGASGTYAAHVAAFPDEDWQTFARAFVSDLGFNFAPLVTQINPGDDLAGLFDSLQTANQILIDLAGDAWLYVSRRYLGQEAIGSETGSSTMPHKVNPIDFENAEGNLSKANADLEFLGNWLTTSRLQRDLTDSTVKRNIGSALAHCLLGATKLGDGLETVVPNEQVMREDLEANPAVIAEAIQTILRREGHADAYERVKQLTRGENPSLADLRAAIEDLDVTEAVKDELRALEPTNYTGLASALVDSLDA